MKKRHIGKLLLDCGPYVVGTAVSEPTLQSPNVLSQCDILELRLDQLDGESNSWLEECKRLEAGGLPVLITCRLAVEGGAWGRPDAERRTLLNIALAHVSAVDIEWRSELKEELCREAARHDKCVIVSYHNFSETPSLAELKALVRQVQQLPAAIPKIATMLNSPADIEILQKLIHETTDTPLCVLGMGPLAGNTRVTFAKLGSALTYGYLDTPCAPGQPASEILVHDLGPRPRLQTPHPTDNGQHAR